MRRLLGSSGSAIVFALVAVMLITTLGVFTVSRASDSETRSGNQRVNSIADAAADAAVAAAIARIQRVGSAKGDTDETSGSTLDLQNANINGADSSDGVYNIKVQSGQPGCSNPRQRLLTVTAKAELQTRRRFLCFWIVPRTLRFGLYTDGSSGTVNAAEVKSGFSLLLPPPYKAPTGARGSDLGSNGDVLFSAGSYANDRRSAVPAIRDLYDYLFVPSGVTPTTDVPYRYGTAGNPGVRWGSVYRSPKLAGEAGSAVPLVTGANVAGVNFDTPAAINSNTVNTFAPVTLATRTQPADFSQKLASWRQKATSQGNLYVPSDVQSTPDDFQTTMNQLGSQTMQGIVYVGCTDNQTITIPNGKKLSIDGGALIIEGCNLVIESGASLTVLRDLSDPYSKIKGSNTGSCSSSGELASSPGGCAWAYPGLAVLSDPDNRGGNVTSRASGADYVNINGNVIISKNLTIEGGTLPAGGRLGNWNTAGSAFIDGKFDASGTGGAAVFRWIPLAQRMDFDYTTARIGTYSLRTEERALPTSKPIVVFTTKPVNPSDRTTSAEFAWTIAGSYDTVDCTLVKDGGAPSTIACADLSATLSGLEFSANYTFAVKACVLALDASRTQLQLCDTASYDWYIAGPPATVTIDNASKPTTNVPNNGSPTFTWTTQNNPNTIDCRIDGGAWAACLSPPGRAFSSLSVYQSHTFEVRACNINNPPCGTDIYTWYVVGGPPTLSFTANPANPAATFSGVTNTATGGNFTWQVTNSVPITGYQCQLDGGVWAACSTAVTPASYSTGALANNEVNGVSHTFSVRGLSLGGTGTAATYSWVIYPNQPAVPTWSPIPPTVDYGSGSSTGGIAYSGAAATYECYDNRGASNTPGWYGCGTPNSFQLKGYCTNTVVGIRAKNISGTSGETVSSPGTHRNCNPPEMTLRWTSGVHGADKAWTPRSIEQSIGTNMYVRYCRVAGDTWAAGNTTHWEQNNWCPNPWGVSWITRTTWFWMNSYGTANDGSRDTLFGTWSNYNSDAFGRQCAYVPWSDAC